MEKVMENKNKLGRYINELMMLSMQTQHAITHDLAIKVGKPTARQIKTKNNKYMASDCPLAGKHIKQLADDTNIVNDEAVHPIEIVSKSYGL